MLENTDDRKAIHWALFRNHAQPTVYLELEERGRNFWRLTIDDEEVTVRTAETDPIAVLTEALVAYSKSAQDLPDE